MSDFADDESFEEPPWLKPVHRLATLLWAGPLLTAIALFIWAAARTPRRIPHSIVGDGDGFFAVVVGILLVVACVPYAILAALVRAERRWAVVTLGTVAGLHGGVHVYFLLAAAAALYRAHSEGVAVAPQVTWLAVAVGYTVGLFGAAYSCKKLSRDMFRARRQAPGGFPIVMRPRQERNGPVPKRAA